MSLTSPDKPDFWLEKEEVKELQDLYDNLIENQFKEFNSLHDRQRQETDELVTEQKFERTKLFRENGELSFALAAGLVKRKRV